MKLHDYVRKLYEGGQIDDNEYTDFQKRYQTSEGEEKVQEQVRPDFGTSEGSQYEPHEKSPEPNEGYDEYMTVEPGEQNFPEGEDALSRQEYMRALKKRKKD